MKPAFQNIITHSTCQWLHGRHIRIAKNGTFACGKRTPSQTGDHAFDPVQHIWHPMSTILKMRMKDIIRQHFETKSCTKQSRHVTGAMPRQKNPKQDLLEPKLKLWGIKQQSLKQLSHKPRALRLQTRCNKEGWKSRPNQLQVTLWTEDEALQPRPEFPRVAL